MSYWDKRIDDCTFKHSSCLLGRQVQAVQKLEEETNEFVNKVAVFLQEVASIEMQSPALLSDPGTDSVSQNDELFVGAALLEELK